MQHLAVNLVVYFGLAITTSQCYINATTNEATLDFHGNTTVTHGNRSDDGGHDAHGSGNHSGIHVASWNWDYVDTPWLACLFFMGMGLCKLCMYSNIIYF